MGKFKTFISGAVLSLFFGVSPVSAELFGLSSFVLDNGMQVLVIPNHKAPIIKHMVWYKAGSVDEPRGKGGTAHLLEHLMFRGTRKVKDGVFNDLISRNGGESNAFTSLDYTAYHQELDISRLELAMFLEADRMQNLKITPEAFAKERDIVFRNASRLLTIIRCLISGRACANCCGRIILMLCPWGARRKILWRLRKRTLNVL